VNVLKNLLLVVQTIAPKRSAVQRLRNISLEVPDSLVAIPSDFKPIEHDSWKKVESAKVIYKGRPSKDYGVFRAPGGELFIWIEDAFYPWHYLYNQQIFVRRRHNRFGSEICQCYLADKRLQDCFDPSSTV